MTDEYDITTRLSGYASALGDEVEPTTADEITTSSAARLTDTSAAADATGLSDRQDSSNHPSSPEHPGSSDHPDSPDQPQRFIIPTLVAATALILVAVGAFWMANDNSDPNNEIAATGVTTQPDTPNNDSATPPIDPTSTDPAPNDSGPFNDMITNPVPVVVRGTLMVDPRGHTEICMGIMFRGDSCAGVPIVGADRAEDWHILQSGVAPQGGRLFLVASGQLGEEGLWVNSYEESLFPSQWEDVTSDYLADCQSQECHAARQDRVAAFTDTLNSMVATDSNLSITTLEFRMQPGSSDDTAVAIHALIEVPVLDTDTREQLEALGRLTNDTLGPFELELFVGIELTNGASIADMANFYPSEAPILTKRGPSHGSMMALLTGTLTFDDATGCSTITPTQGADRGANTGGDSETGSGVHVMWPFGYTASATDQTIMNFDGDVVARVGDTVELGGGHVPYEVPAHYQETCGATGDVFVTSGLEPNL